MAVNQWFLQFLADQCQLLVEKPQDIETTAKGAAILAAIGYGIFDSLAALKNVWDVEQAFQPNRAIVQVEKDYKGWRRALNSMMCGDK